MVIGWVSKLALATVATLGLYAPTLGLPIPGSCVRTGGVASAAPSPTCAGDLRDCLRVSAREGLYGVRYVTAEDVARCMEAFNSCIHGSASGGGNQAPPTSRSTEGGNGNSTLLPQRFTMTVETSELACRLNGNGVSCNGEGTMINGTYTSEVTGTLSGLTMAGTLAVHGYSPGFCTSQSEASGPIAYDFSPDGTVAVRQGPQQVEVVYSGGCSDSPPSSSTSPSWSGTGTWSPMK